MVEVFGDSLVFNSQKVAMLTFNMVFEQRAKNQLLYLNSHLLLKFLTNYNKKIQSNYEKAKDQDLKAELVETLGTTYFIINKVQQLQHELQDRFHDIVSPPKDIFLLREEIMQIVESLSFQCLTNDAQLKLDIK